MKERNVPYGFGITIQAPYEGAVERVREALADEGFGVLTEIDVRETLKKKLDADFRPYVILGACNPPLARDALNSETDVGLLLPCNVIVYEGEDADQSVVMIMDPEAALSLADNDALRPLAADVKSRMERVLSALTDGSST